MSKIAVALMSGGLDSAVSAALAHELGWSVQAITVDYGQRHRIEIEAAEKVADKMDIPWKLVQVPDLATAAFHSALTNHEMELPANRSPDHMTDGIPISYVPMRNSVLLSIACAMLESLVLSGVGDGMYLQAGIVIGANAVDYSGYPDCRPEYYEAMTRALTLGSSMGVENKLNNGIELITPVIEMTKAQVVSEGLRLKVPVKDTWSCYAGGPSPCGTCDSCILRDRAFQEAKVA